MHVRNIAGRVEKDPTAVPLPSEGGKRLPKWWWRRLLILRDDGYSPPAHRFVFSICAITQQAVEASKQAAQFSDGSRTHATLKAGGQSDEASRTPNAGSVTGIFQSTRSCNLQDSGLVIVQLARGHGVSILPTNSSIGGPAGSTAPASQSPAVRGRRAAASPVAAVHR